MSAITFCFLLSMPLTLWTLQAVGGVYRAERRALARVRREIHLGMM